MTHAVRECHRCWRAPSAPAPSHLRDPRHGRRGRPEPSSTCRSAPSPGGGRPASTPGAQAGWRSSVLVSARSGLLSKLREGVSTGPNDCVVPEHGVNTLDVVDDLADTKVDGNA